MRLIDADTLKMQAIEMELPFPPYNKRSHELIVFVYDINDAPTVDAEIVRHAKWIHLGGDEWCCTACGEVIHTEGSWEEPTRKYCHECGAKIDVEV